MSLFGQDWKYAETIYHWQKIAYAQSVSQELLNSFPSGIVDLKAECSNDFDFMRDVMTVRLSAYVLKHDLGLHSVNRAKTVHFPASPFQHWKQKHAESWWLRRFVTRWPVREQHVKVDFQEAWQEMAVYPWQELMPARDPRMGNAVRIVTPTVTWSETWSE